MSHGTTIMGDKKFPELKRCSVAHDKAYIARTKSRRQADREFRMCMEEVCAACTNPKRAKQLRQAMRQRHFFVRWFGWAMWYT